MVNTEKKLQLRILLKLLIAVAFAFLYAWGGMEYKFLRRIVAPAVLCGGMFLFSYNWHCLIQLPLMMVSLSLGYGAESLIAKIIKRLIFGLANGASSSAVNILQKRWFLVIVQIVLITGAFITFGVFNPLPSARAEESLLGILIPLIPLLSLKDK